MNGQAKGSLKTFLIWLVIGVSIIALFNILSVPKKMKRR